MSHQVKITVHLYRYIGTTSAVRGDPHFCIYTYKPSNDDWLFVKDVVVETTVDMTAEETIQGAVGLIEQVIKTKRLDLEEEVKQLNDRKQDLLSITFEA